MQRDKGILYVFVVCCLLVFSASQAMAFGGWGGKGKGKKMGKKKRKMTLEQMQDKGLIATGLTPIYPTEATCLEIASAFASERRYDGSFRPSFAFHGYHSGIDISVKIGTPIVAIADGTVIQVAEAGRMVGIKITLQHSPEDTGLAEWTYSKYQHLDKMPTLKVGEPVKMGEVIGLAGRTGTTGGHYGSRGYPHLHMNVYSGDSEFTVRDGHKLSPINMQFLDPLTFYYQKELDSNVLKDMPAEEKSFAIPYKTTGGKVVPEQTKVVWPFLCEPTQ